ncbi:hemagglutinin repeat-containing protein, partial [bacterium endosymbiont of Bathymodiolus sp. 5 South]|uniref:hemagglutinin repeat-containing protein n=1 Tax=bacterium endosymbiont of Bathymodiolus sp. 5 South TaxID=1181670 RepID=UPI0010B4DD1D
MPTLKKPFSLLLILSHLNAFVLSGVGNAYAVNQEVNTANVNVATNGVLNISSVQDSKSVQMKSSAKGLFSSSVSASTKATTTNIASNLTANNLTIETTKEDINITGSNIDAQQQLSLNSAKDINIKAGYDGSLNESYHKTSGLSLGGLVGIGPLYTSTEDLEGRIKKTAVNSTLSGNNITLNANNNINAAGVNIQADNSISGTAKDINIQNVNNTDTHYSKHKKVKVSLADVLGTIAKNPLLLKKESDGKVSFTLATATIDKEAERSTKTTV